MACLGTVLPKGVRAVKATKHTRATMHLEVQLHYVLQVLSIWLSQIFFDIKVHKNHIEFFATLSC
jgi:hypothetical protein